MLTSALNGPSPPGRDQNRTPLTSMFLPGCNMYNQNRFATSQNALALHF
jgi:hypothetical protein